MSVPAKKKPKSATKRRRSHQALKRVKLVKCPKCSKPTLPHHACPNCGTYQGREVIKFKEKKKKTKGNK